MSAASTFPWWSVSFHHGQLANGGGKTETMGNAGHLLNPDAPAHDSYNNSYSQSFLPQNEQRSDLILSQKTPKKIDIFSSQIKITTKSFSEIFQISVNTFITETHRLNRILKSALEKVGLDSISVFFFFSV